jgi:iron complex outermembrane receptor protein
MPRLSLITLLLGCAALNAFPAAAQGTSGQNAVTQAEDAFGLNLGRESIGLYDDHDVRGFSPESAGNTRINGLYFDQAWWITPRLRKAMMIRVGLSAFGFPFPAPTGVVDYQLRRPGAEPSRSIFVTTNQYGTMAVEADAVIPMDGERLSLDVGFGAIRESNVRGTPSFRVVEAAQLLWRPNERFELQPFISHVNMIDQYFGAILVPNGPWLPPLTDPRHDQGPTWTKFDSSATNYGVLTRWEPAPGWTLRAGLFRSIFDNGISHTSIIDSLMPDGRGHQYVYTDPPSKAQSTSGEVRLTRQFSEGERLHTLHVMMRGRDRSRSYGGSVELDLGNVRLGGFQATPQPAFTFTPQSFDTVQQWASGLAYEGRWRDVGELNLGVQYTSYEKTIRQPGQPVAVNSARLWLWNASVAVNLSPDLVAYAGTTRGLEESGLAPSNAANRDAALPAIQTKQVDAGLRWRITPKLSLIAGVFEISKPYFNLDHTNVWRELGNVRHRGVELSFSGELSPGLSIVAGAVLLDAEVSGPAVALGRVGKRPVGSTPTTLLFNIDWAPEHLHGISFDAGVYYFGNTIANGDNSVTIPANASLDIGMRYPFKAGDADMSLRFQINNLTDRRGLNLAGSGAYTMDGGRNFQLSLSADF